MNATGASANSDSLPASLAVQAHNLYKQDLLSDIKLILADNQTFPGHKFLLTARSKEWKASQVGFQNGSNLAVIYKLGYHLGYRWCRIDVRCVVQNDFQIILKLFYTAGIVGVSCRFVDPLQLFL